MVTTALFCIFVVTINKLYKKKDYYDYRGQTLNKQLKLSDGNEVKRHRDRKGRLSDSEIMTILVAYHFGTFSNFKSYYLFFIKIHMHRDFPDAVSYNRFVELMPRVFFKMMLLEI